MLGLGGRGRVRQRHAALSAHRSLCRACFCVVFRPLSHLLPTHPSQRLPSPVDVLKPRAHVFSSRSPSPRGPPGGRVPARPQRAPRCHRPVRPGLPCSPRSPPLWLSSSPCLSPRRVRVLSSEPLCCRPTAHTHALSVLTSDPGPYPRPQCSPPSSQCFSDTTRSLLPEGFSQGCFPALSFPSGLLISTKMSPPPWGHPSITQSKITIIYFLLYHSFISLHST